MTVYKKICKECGKTFETTSNRRMFCYDDHYRVCISCGEKFLIPSNKLPVPPKTCSEECRRKAISNSEIYKTPRFLCKCDLCGKEFLSPRKNARICNEDHIINCVICGKEIKLTHTQAVSGTTTCSKECKYELMRRNNFEKYGYENVGCVPEFTQKRYETNIEIYGFKNPMQNPDIAKQSADTRSLHQDEITEHIRQGNKRNHGYDWPMQNPEVQKKSKDTCWMLYDTDNFAKSEQHVTTKLHDPSKAKFNVEFRNDPKAYIEKYFPTRKPTLEELGESCGMRASSAGQIILDKNLQDAIQYVYSQMEYDVYTFLRSVVGEEVNIIRNTFRVITPYELDLYLPDYNLAIECNPTITHNSTISGFGPNDTPKDINYHKMKSDLCREHDIFLFHIFGYEWTHKKEIIKSILKDILSINYIDAFNLTTSVKIVSDDDAAQFISINSRSDIILGDITLGLYINDILQVLITVSKELNTIESSWKLLGVCKAIDSNIVNGELKLLRYFFDTYPVNKLVTISDKARSPYTMYKQLGFKECKHTDPSSTWVNLKTDAVVLNFNDVSNDNYVQVFDSGNIVWELIR